MSEQTSSLNDKAQKAIAKATEKADDRFAHLLEKFGDVQLKLLEAAQKTTLSPEALEAILTRVGAQSGAAMQKALRPENELPPLMSAFNPFGDRDHPKRGLDRKTFLNEHPEHTGEQTRGPYAADMLTQAEIDAYNDLGRTVEAKGGTLDARNGLYTAVLHQRGTELHVSVPVAKLDSRLNLPPTLIMLCHELKTGESLTDLNGLLNEVVRLRAELAALASVPVQNAVTPTMGTPRMATTAPMITVAAGPLVADLEQALDATPPAQLKTGP